MSTSNAGQAFKLGYKNVKVYLEGVPVWKKSGHHVEASEEFIKKGNIVLVDLRPQKIYEAGHIPRAYNFPMEDFEYAEYEFPTNMNAPIVLYGDGKDARIAYKIVKGWGYKTGSVASLDFAAWKKAGYPIETGATPDEIVWKRILDKNEVTIADFMKAVEGAPDKLVLDVRSNDEVAEGKVPGARHIPLDDLAEQMATLPKDKEILVHCTTGARAEMASTELRTAGFKSRYLVAACECDGTECQFSE